MRKNIKPGKTCRSQRAGLKLAVNWLNAHLQNHYAQQQLKMMRLELIQLQAQNQELTAELRRWRVIMLQSACVHPRVIQVINHRETWFRCLDCMRLFKFVPVDAKIIKCELDQQAEFVLK